MINWFLFDLGNTLIKLAYERVLESICKRATISRDDLVELLEEPGGYRELERGVVTFEQFHGFLRDRAEYRGSFEEFHAVWSDFFDGPIPGMEDVLERLRERYRIAFISNSNEVHAEVIPKKFAALFRPEDRIILSHRFKVAKPDPELFHRALEVIGSKPGEAAFIDDLLENVIAARSIGLLSYQFRDAPGLMHELKADGLL
jgi:HAD superfamily hydrolase (TIGR01509 family)